MEREEQTNMRISTLTKLVIDCTHILHLLAIPSQEGRGFLTSYRGEGRIIYRRVPPVRFNEIVVRRNLLLNSSHKSLPSFPRMMSQRIRHSKLGNLLIHYMFPKSLPSLEPLCGLSCIFFMFSNVYLVPVLAVSPLLFLLLSQLPTDSSTFVDFYLAPEVSKKKGRLGSTPTRGVGEEVSNGTQLARR